MLTGFRRDKLARRFSQLDFDGDGQLQHDDLATMAARLCDGLVPADRPDLRAEFATAYDELWKALLGSADADKDGKVSLEEYVTAVERDPARFEGSVRRIGMALFDSIDDDGSDVVDPQELFRLGSAFGLSRQETDALFERLDRDGSGEIGSEEWLAAIRDFYYGDDPESAGSLLFGRVL
ncbi:EF-hand domain-containing protein [Nonomuraea sp. KM90]|uniref:EF-hand domain-containing protein n=1 Tax=Nonomuraea sp. KM90 TaxID=3457428 RepID=UPI003FCCCB41